MCKDYMNFNKGIFIRKNIILRKKVTFLYPKEEMNIQPFVGKKIVLGAFISIPKTLTKQVS